MEKKEGIKPYISLISEAAGFSFLFIVPLIIKAFLIGNTQAKPWKYTLMPYGCPYFVGKFEFLSLAFFFYILIWIPLFCLISLVLFYRRRKKLQIYKGLLFTILGAFFFPLFFYILIGVIGGTFQIICFA